MKRPSASNVESFVMCTASHVLPQHEVFASYTLKGTAGHEPLAAKINNRVSSDQDAIRMTAKFPLAELLQGVTDIRAEVAYAVDVKTKRSRLIGIDVGRNYGVLGPYEIGVTIDVEGMAEGAPWIRDWKFGRTSSWWQAYVQAMAVLWRPGMEGHSEVDAGFVYIDGDTGGADYHQDASILYLSDLDERAEEIVKALARAEQMAADLKAQQSIKTTEGSWCTYCGAYPYCPSKTRLVRAMLMDLGDFDQTIALLSPEQCGSAWQKLKEIQKLAAKLEDTLKTRMEAEPFPLPNGKVLRMVETKGWPYFDKDRTYSLLREKGASETEIKNAMKMRAGSKSAKETKA
jgi:hypothetical protein